MISTGRLPRGAVSASGLRVRGETGSVAPILRIPLCLADQLPQQVKDLQFLVADYNNVLFAKAGQSSVDMNRGQTQCVGKVFLAKGEVELCLGVVSALREALLQVDE